MAQTINKDGTVSTFVIGQDESQAVLGASVKLNKDGSVRKKRGPAKKYTFERKTISAMVAVPDYTDLVAAFGTPSDAINALIRLWRSNG